MYETSSNMPKQASWTRYPSTMRIGTHVKGGLYATASTFGLKYIPKGWRMGLQSAAGGNWHHILNVANSLPIDLQLRRIPLEAEIRLPFKP